MIAAVLLLSSLAIAAPSTTTVPTATTPELKERVLVYGFKSEGVDERIVKSIERAVVETAVDNGYEAISSQDIATMLDMEATRQASGCDGASSCVAELAGGLGARLVVTGTVVRLDARRYELSLTLLEQNATTVRGRASVDAERAAGLRDVADDATRRLFGVAPKVLRRDVDNTPSVLWISGGIVGVVAGGVGVAMGVLQYTNALTNKGYVEAAAADYKDSGDVESLDTMAAAHAAYVERAEAWDTWGRPMAVIGGVVVVAGVAAIVVGATGLE